MLRSAHLLKTPPIDDVLLSLRAARHRLLGQTFLAIAGPAALLGAAVLVVVAAVRRWLLGEMPWNGFLALGVGLVVLALTLAVTFARRRTLPQTAAVIDRLGQTHDRFVSALAFSGSAAAPELQALAVQECSAYLRSGDFARLVRLRVPHELPWLLVPAVALALLQWEARVTFTARDAQAAAGRAAVEDTARKLETLAQQTEKTNELAQSAELKRLAEELKRGAEQLRTAATDPAEAAKAALRELSALEQTIQQMQKATPSPEELKALAQALQKTEPTRAAAAAMEAGELEKAIAELEKAAQEMADKKDQRTADEIAQALQEALQQLAQKQAMSAALQKLAEQLQQKAGGASSEALRQLAEMLQKLPKSGGKSAQSGGTPADAQTLQNLLAALQNLKFGEGQESSGEPPPGGSQPGSIALQSFAKKPGEGEGDAQLPSGQPGGEHDQGTTASPFGKDPLAAGQNAAPQSVTGQLGAGESLSQFLPSATDSSKSQRRYKELYEALAPAAEDAVVQENVPLGSRFFIKKYFQSIRPRE